MLTYGATIDRYRIEALVGQGGMAAVYRARHVQLDSAHAIKVLFVTVPSLRHRLLQEGRVQANLRHPNIVSVTDVLEVSGAPALVMEFVAGPSLDVWLQDHRPTLDESLWLFHGIVRGITAAHDRAVVHRDLKPANVLLGPTSEGMVPKVTDFGLVKSLTSRDAHTQTGMALGTPEYMSPEQIRDASQVDQRTDMWALGCILYELVCGARAFTGPDRMTVFNRIVAGDFVPPRDHAPDIPDHVEQVIVRLLQVDRERRLTRGQELLDALYPHGPRKAPIQVPERLTPPLLGTMPLTFQDDDEGSGAQALEAPSDLLRDVRTAEPALTRVLTGTRHARPSTRATAEFPVYRQRSSRGWGWSMAVPIVVATVVGLAMTLVLVDDLTPRRTPPPGSTPADAVTQGPDEAVVDAEDADVVEVPQGQGGARGDLGEPTRHDASRAGLPPVVDRTR